MKDNKQFLPAAAVAAIAVLAFAPSALSQEADIAWMGTGSQIFGVHAGGQIFDVADQLDEVGTDLTTEFNVGARYQYDFTEHVGFEADVTFSPSNFDFVGPGIGPRDVNTIYYTGNIVYNILPDNDVIPYVTGGAGALTLFVDDAAGEADGDTKFVGNVGAGLLFPVADRFGLRFEVRDYIYKLDDLESDIAQDLDFPAGFSETVNDFAITGGISILF